MLQRILTTAFLATGLVACNQHTHTQTTDSSLQAKTGNAQQQERKIIDVNDKSLSEEVNTAALHLLGVKKQLDYTKTQEALAALLPGLMKAIADSKGVIAGSYYIAILEKPQAGKPVSVFLGVPLKKALSVKGYENLEINAGKHIKTQLGAEPGTALSSHLNQLQLMEKRGINTGYPILETYAETRNNDMTTVISKATFLYPVK
jgi:hypothetical protein